MYIIGHRSYLAYTKILIHKRITWKTYVFLLLKSICLLPQIKLENDR